MRYRYTIALLLSLFVLLQCDFPSDPPLKPGGSTPVTPPVKPEIPAELVPLHNGNAWLIRVKPWSQPERDPVWVPTRALSFEGKRYFHLFYGIPDTGPSGNLQAFPSILRSDSSGLHFFIPRDPDDTLNLTRDPIYTYSLPYPEAPTGFISNPYSSYDVRLTHLDTMLTMEGTSATFACRRYEVWRAARLRTVFYIVPGLCFLRVVDDDDGVYQTLGWRISN
ncbi:MAG: hypothetical protein C0600_08175 [Ignavibacteria bacterium]|nr:MAG: hypothetical protein C0600_08175 [Ignavibacteria bacterium]